ncbi:MAG: hypothetical protein AAB305_00330 [Candidatus Zixiibacteriota bacterium]
MSACVRIHIHLFAKVRNACPQTNYNSTTSTPVGGVAHLSGLVEKVRLDEMLTSVIPAQAEIHLVF